VFSTEDSLLTFGGSNVGDGGDGSASLGLLVQNWQMQYQQQVMELFEIGTNALYWSKGRPVGNGAVGRIIGDADADSEKKGFFPKKAYDLCDGGELVVITAKSGACEGFKVKEVSISMDGVVVTSIGFSMQVQDVQLRENIGWRFASLEIK
jgi:hypothetical protein